MGLFDKLFSNKNNASCITVLSPVNGTAIPLSEVDDPTFAEEMIGKGMAVIPSSGTIVAPVDGVVNMVFETKHALGITSKDGVELLIHVGLDTVSLKGEHYTAKVKTGDTIVAGDLLLEFDIPKIQEAGYPVVTPVVICNTDDYKTVTGIASGEIKALEPLLSLTKG
ncbi:MAG: PTS glucose transporter subunit IIA [Eubacteriales bacterium]